MDPEFKSFLEEHGIPDPKQYERDEEPPESVDTERIRAFYAQELGEDETEWIAFLISRYRAWREAGDHHVLEMGKASDVSASTKRSVDGMIVGRRTWLALAASMLVAVTVGVWVATWPSPRIVATIVDSFGEITKDADGNVSGVDTYPDDWRPRIRSMIEKETVTYPARALAFLPTTRSGSAQTMYVTPVDTVVDTRTPTFRWKVREKTDKYRILVHREFEGPDEKRRLALQTETLSAAEWTTTEELERGQVYSWQVVVSRGDEELVSDELRPYFKILEEEKHDDLEETIRNAGDSRLARTVAFLEYGLLDRAEQELRELAENNPQSALAEALLKSLLRAH